MKYKYRYDEHGLHPRHRFPEYFHNTEWFLYWRNQNKNNGIYGEIAKQLIDDWISISKYATASTYDVFLSSFINDHPLPKTNWRYFFQKLSIDELKKLFEIPCPPKKLRYINFDNNIYIYRSTRPQSNAIRYELLTSYLYVNSRIWNHPWEAKSIDHYLGGDGAYVEFQDYNTTPNKVRITLNSVGSYDIDNNGTHIPNCDIHTLENELQKIGVITAF